MVVNPIFELYSSEILSLTPEVPFFSLADLYLPKDGAQLFLCFEFHQKSCGNLFSLLLNGRQHHVLDFASRPAKSIIFTRAIYSKGLPTPVLENTPYLLEATNSGVKTLFLQVGSGGMSAISYASTQ